MHKYILSIGSNLGERLNNLSEGVCFLSRRGELLSVSSIYETSPVDMESPASFLNCALHYRTYLAPLQMLDFGQYIEERLGRVQVGENQPRQIDIDLIRWSGGNWQDERLIIPHPEAEKRAFVCVPVNELLPDTFPDAEFKEQKIEYFCKGEILFLLH